MAFSGAGDVDMLLLTQIPTYWADETTHIFDRDHIKPSGIATIQCILNLPSFIFKEMGRIT
jgi:hypothetical protein